MCMILLYFLGSCVQCICIVRSDVQNALFFQLTGVYLYFQILFVECICAFISDLLNAFSLSIIYRNACYFQVDGVTGKTWTYAQLQDAIIKVGSVLTKQGIKKGDIVTLCSPNCPEFAIVFLAITAVGGVVSTVNPLYTPGTILLK